MKLAREEMLADIRAALSDVGRQGTGGDQPIPRAYRQIGSSDRPAAIAEFEERARGYKVRVEQVERPQARWLAARLLRERGLIRMALPNDFPGDLLPEGFELVPDCGLGNAAIAACDGVLTTCACAIAQTGTIVLDHGAGQGRRVLTLLPDYHLCFVEAGRIVDLVAEAVAWVKPAVIAGRPLTFVSGPSATSDIELSRVEGVHGPRTLDVVFIV